jgi:DNA uptake protein ComE-like DNA-binding protein
MLLSVLSFTVLMTSCGSGAEKAPSNTTVSNTPGAATNQSANNTAVRSDTAKAKLNLNTASGNDFITNIPGLGNRMVHEFEEYRPYRSIQQFRREMGKYVNAAQIAEYEKYVYVPIAENDADAATLQQIPGLDAAEAEALMAGRPYASPDAFLSKLSEKVSPEELAVAKNYLSR